MGQYTAGATFLKKLIELEDGASMYLTTAKVYTEFKQPLGFEGITPDLTLDPSVDSLETVLKSLEGKLGASI